MDEYLVEEFLYTSAVQLNTYINNQIEVGWYLLKMEKLYDDSNRYGQDITFLLVFCRSKTAKLLYGEA